MVPLSCAVIGDQELPKELGKLGSHTDIAIYNRKTEDQIFSFISPVTFPEKTASLLTALAVSDVAIMVFKELSPWVGEAVIALSEMGIDRGLIILEGLAKEQVASLLSGTSLEGYTYVERAYPDIIRGLTKFKSTQLQGGLRLPLDHFFITKTVGLVGIGRVGRGVLKIHEKLSVLPSGKEGQVKSIQVQDVTMKEAPTGFRAGVALKGVEESDLTRGSILTDTPEDFVVSHRIRGDFTVNPFFKQPLTTGQMVQVTLGLQTETAEVVETIPLKTRRTFTVELGLAGDKKVVYEVGERFILTRPELKGLRIIGSGRAAG